MSVYSGFATRALEGNYNKTLYNMLFVLQTRITRGLKNGIVRKYRVVALDELQFRRHFSKLYTRLLMHEESKHMPPKYSYAMKDLADFYGIYEKLDPGALTSISSNLSFSHYSNFNGIGSTPTEGRSEAGYKPRS